MADAKELETLRVRWKWFFFFGKALCPFWEGMGLTESAPMHNVQTNNCVW
jgi:hypothetical protein